MTNEYRELLAYLENFENEEGGASKQKKSSPKQKEIKKSEPQPKKPKKRETISDNTKKILNESGVDDFSELKKTGYQKKSSSTKGFSVERFESLMRAKLIEGYKKTQSYERPYISCTELYNCLRQNFYARMKYQVDTSKLFTFPYLYLMQKAGNLIHEIFQDLYNFTETEKTIVSETYKVKGRVDALRDDVLYEIKTLDPPKFKGSYIEEHYLQGIVYAYILKTEYDYKIETITIIYVIRDLKKIHPFDLPPNDELAKKLLDRSLILLDSIKSKKVPEPIAATKHHCKYCLYKKYCEKDGFSNMKPPFIIEEEKTPRPPKKKKEKKSAFLL